MAQHATRNKSHDAPRGERKFHFVQLDVFTRRKLAGNSLAVFTDARGLSDAEMQALAREMNLSETTFILPGDAKSERERGIKVRIFTVEEELDFAGHPTLGTAFVLRGRSKAHEVRLDLRVGTIPVRFEAEPDGGAFGEMRQRDPEFGSTHSREAVARAIGVTPDEIAPDLPIQTVSTGLAFAILPLRSVETLERLRPAWSNVEEVLAGTDARFFYFLAPAGQKGKMRSRMFFYNGEDPATGSAAGTAAAWMVKHGVAQSDEQVHIRQGVEMRRPSDIFVRASREGDRVVNVRVGGHAVEILRGDVFL